jgi:hypothetical protein
MIDGWPTDREEHARACREVPRKRNEAGPEARLDGDVD